MGRLVGGRLKRLRKLRGLTLEEVGSAVSVSHSFLSMLERGQVDISLDRLDRLAHFYGIALSELLLEEGLHAEPTVIPMGEGLTVDRGPGVTYRILPDHPYLGLQLMHVVFEPKARFTDFRAHRGYDVIFVCRGALTLLYDDRSYAIEAQQLVIYAATSPHALANDGHDRAEVFAITTPPYW
jgi:quercetin dioxygenase-like cupin family protein